MSLAPRLVSLRLDDDLSWIGKEDADTWGLFASLKELYLGIPYSEDAEGRRLTNCLRSLPAPLTKLDIFADDQLYSFF